MPSSPVTSLVICSSYQDWLPSQIQFSLCLNAVPFFRAMWLVCRENYSNPRAFSHGTPAEQEIFGSLNFLPANVSTLSLKKRLNLVRHDPFHVALDSEIFLVFEASFINGWVADELVAQLTLNIRMNLRPTTEVDRAMFGHSAMGAQSTSVGRSITFPGF